MCLHAVCAFCQAPHDEQGLGGQSCWSAWRRRQRVAWLSRSVTTPCRRAGSVARALLTCLPDTDAKHASLCCSCECPPCERSQWSQYPACPACMWEAWEGRAASTLAGVRPRSVLQPAEGAGVADARHVAPAAQPGQAHRLAQRGCVPSLPVDRQALGHSVLTGMRRCACPRRTVLRKSRADHSAATAILFEKVFGVVSLGYMWHVA